MDNLQEMELKMSYYRRANRPGGTYFFTVVSYRRQAILCDGSIRDAINKTQKRYPFDIDAWVLLPNHLHCIWTLPDGDANFSKRWGKIKRHVSMACRDRYKRTEWLSDSKKKHRESTLWQRRYWEHQIRDQDDFNRHVDYIHYNPVKHELCKKPIEWPYSTLHRFIKEGKYPMNWAMQDSGFDERCFGE